MKIRLLVSRASIREHNHAGDVIELPADKAQKLIQTGQAEIVRSEPPIERAIKKPVKRRATRAKAS